MARKEGTQVGAGPGQYGSDRELFERVWRRVMPEEPVPTEGDSIGIDLSLPFALPTQAQPRLARASDGIPSPQPQNGQGEGGTLAVLPSEPLPLMKQESGYLALSHRADTEPEPVCLGPGSAQHSGQLQDLIRQALLFSRHYQQLSRRATGMASHTLATMSNTEKRHAKRLSTALFLVTGVKYWPSLDKVGGREEPPFAAQLRRLFLAEQRAESVYRGAAELTEDTCLQELYLEIAQEKGVHMGLIRSVLEQM